MDFLGDDERALVDKLESDLSSYQTANVEHERYYDGTFQPRMLGIGLPENARNLKMVVGWPATAVDVLEERLDITGWQDSDLDDCFHDNALAVEASQVHTDALVYGCSFVSVTAGGEDEPEQLVRGHAATQTTGVLNSRTGLLDAAISIRGGDNGREFLTLWTSEEIVETTRAGGGAWEVIDRTEHGLGRVPMVAFVNRPRVGNRRGQSEITAAVRRYTDSAVRALLAMDVNREFFSAPQRYIVGASEDQFVDAAGRPRNPWEIVTGRVWAVGPSDEGEEQPKLGQFDPMSPGPYLDQVKGLALQFAAEAGIPPMYLGVATDQAASADAIRAMEARLVKRAERRQVQFGRSWAEVARLVRAGREGGLAREAEASAAKWREASTPTLAATADAMMKLVQTSILPASSSVVLDRLGFDPQEQTLIRNESAREQAGSRLAQLKQLAQSASGEAVEAARQSRAVGDSHGDE